MALINWVVFHLSRSLITLVVVLTYMWQPNPNLGLGCHIYVHTITKVIGELLKRKTTQLSSDLIKCELLGTLPQSNMS